MSRRTTTHRSRIASLLAACAIAASLASCDRSDPVQDEIDRVSSGMGALSTSGSTSLPSVEHRKAVYQWAVDRMSGRASARDPIATEIARPAGTYNEQDPGRPQKVVADAPAPSVVPVEASNSGQAFAANLLVARGYGGLGEISAQEAAKLESDTARLIPPISAALDQWLAQNAAADALEAFNPAEEMASIEKMISDKQKLADDARAGKDRQLATIADLEKQAADLMANSRSLRQRALEIRSSATGVSETARLDLITEAARVGREADEIEKSAAMLLARVDLEKPGADTLQRGIDELTTQIQLLRADKDNLRQRADRNTAAAQRARAEARSAAEQLTQMVSALTAARDTLSGPTDAAVGSYEKAVAAARKAGQAAPQSKGQAAVATGFYQHALADVLAGKARGLTAYSDALATLASARPALPAASDFSSKASAAAADAKAAIDAAVTAFDAARTQYKGAGGSGDTQDRLTALERAMAAIRGQDPDADMDATPVAEDADAVVPDPAAEPAPAPEGEPADGGLSAIEAEVRTALEQIIAAAKSSDFAALRALMFIPDEAARPAFNQLMDAAAGPVALEAACQRAYGKSLKQLIDESSVQSIKSNPLIAGMQQGMDQMSIGPGTMDRLSAADATIIPTSTTEAMVTFPPATDTDEPQDIALIKDGATWKVNLEPQLAAMGGAAALAQMQPMLAPMTAAGAAFTKVAGKLDAGDYPDVDAMLIDLNKEVMTAMMRSGGAGGPGGGTPGGGS